MALFDQPKQMHPKTWKDYSLEFKFMFAYHICMMILFMNGRRLTIQTQTVVAGALIAVLASWSMWRRKAKDWHWKGVDAKGILQGLGGLTLGGFFHYAASQNFDPKDPQFFPWLLGGGGLVLFNLLQGLRLVHLSEAEFLAECGPLQTPLKYEDLSKSPAAPIDPAWKRALRAIYSVVFLAVWIGGVSFFYFHGQALKNGSPKPTVTHTEPLVEHGETTFITPSEKKILDRLRVCMWVGIPATLLSTLVLHFVIGVKLFPEAGTGSEKRWPWGAS